MNSPKYPKFRLIQWTTIRLQLLWAYQKKMNLPAAGSAENYNFQTAALVCKGWAELGHTEAQRTRAQTGQWLIFKQGRRWQRFSEDCVLLSIGFRFQLPTGEAIFDQGLPLCINKSDHPNLENEAREVLRLMEVHVSTGFMPLEEVVDMRNYLLSQNALRSFLIELADVCHKHNVSPTGMRQENPQVIQALDIINSSPTTSGIKPIRSTKIAEKIGLSPTHLDRMMVAETGHTVHQHIEKRRLHLAQDALLADNESLKSISYTLGFSSPAHFNSWFKKKKNCTPLHYRNQAMLA